MSKVTITLDNLRTLVTLARRNGTESAGLDLAVEFAEAAVDRVAELESILFAIRDCSDKGEIQIAKSLLGTGYEIAIVPRGRPSRALVKVLPGDFIECLRAALRGDAKRQPAVEEDGPGASR